MPGVAAPVLQGAVVLSAAVGTSPGLQDGLLQVTDLLNHRLPLLRQTVFVPAATGQPIRRDQARDVATPTLVMSQHWLSFQVS
jgi:hypothetical protein